MTTNVTCIWCNSICMVNQSGKWKYVHCYRCGASGPRKTTKLEAVNKWNDMKKVKERDSDTIQLWEQKEMNYDGTKQK